MEPLIAIFIRYVIIPEVARVIADHNATANGTTLTNDQIIAKLPADIQAGMGIGQAFLDRTRVAPV